MPDRDHDDEAAEAAAKLEHTREVKRRWREANLDRVHEQSRAWKAANPERVRELNRRWREEHLDRSRQQNRDSARRAAVRRRREAETRRKARERSKRWREEHPEQVRTYQWRWVEANRDKVREYYNRYYETHREEVSARAAARRDADPEGTRRASREWADRNKARRAELQRKRRSDPDIYQAELEANAAARRLKRRLARAGLPPKRLHATSAAERRAHDREADAYFGDPSLNERVRQFTVFAGSLTEHMLEHGATMRKFAEEYAAHRERVGLPPVDVERIVFARAVEIVTDRLPRIDPLTGRDVAAACRSTQAVMRLEERRQQFDRFVKLLASHVEKHLARLTDEAAIENRARRLHRRPPAPLESLVFKVAIEELVPDLTTTRLTVEDVRRAVRAARARVTFAVDREWSRAEPGRGSSLGH
ncbi:hypothetical protein [Agromyces aerolatus]|uniref:hypothetical protein n=1 Tax=Agromyces sp. LY-1074 TaxID=3074080 RepID=UPI00285BACEB|nr:MULTISPECIES: hypothetical protein [unclassified Agromyces]MDR5700716.1 hypothetical protein [Agromyces sp. LY-1074]MDR5707237.1 hypothetical protein [Agromyces sp. LY-1358]